MTNQNKHRMQILTSLSIKKLLAIKLLFLLPLMITGKVYAADKWENIQIKNCPHKLSFVSGIKLSNVKYDSNLIDLLHNNRNRKMVIGWAHSIRQPNQGIPSYYTYFGTLGTLMKVQGKLTKQQFNKLADVFTRKLADWDNYETQVKKEVKRLQSHLPKEVTDNIEFDALYKNKYYITAPNKFVLFSRFQKVNVGDNELNGWNMMQIHYVGGCAISMYSYFDEDLYKEETVLNFAAKTRVELQK